MNSKFFFLYFFLILQVERELNSAGLKYTTRLHESRKPSILKCLFSQFSQKLFFPASVFSKMLKRLLRGACSGKKSYSTERKTTKNTHTATFTQTEGKEEKQRLRKSESKKNVYVDVLLLRCQCIRCEFARIQHRQVFLLLCFSPRETKTTRNEKFERSGEEKEENLKTSEKTWEKFKMRKRNFCHLWTFLKKKKS